MATRMTELSAAVPAAELLGHAGTMQAAIVRDFTQPLRLEEVPIPVPGPGEILVKIEASGLCHTDIHAALGDACGACEYCASGRETLCEQQLNTGYFLDGAYAQYARAHAQYVGKVPTGIDPLDAAPLTCAGVTTYKAVKVSGARPSDLVAVFGIGGLGHLALQYAKAAGAAVVAVDVVQDKLDLARELGADFTVNGREEDPVEAIQKLGGADSAISVAVAPRAFEQAYRSLRRGGTLVFVALPQDNVVQVPIFETVLNGIHIAGSIVGTRVDLQETYELHKMGKTRVIRETIKLEDVNHAFEEVEQARVKARLVFDLR